MSNRSTRAIQKDIEATRERIDRAAAELEDRVSLEHLSTLVMKKLRSSGARQFVDNLGRSVRDHPLPAVLTGIGMRWLITAETRDGAYDQSNGHHPGERARELAHDIGDRSRRVASKARHGAEELTDGLRNGWDQVQLGWNRTMRREPLLLGVLGLAAGVAMAAWAPATETEDELMGATSDHLKQRAATKGREHAEDLRERAEAAGEREQHARPSSPPASEGTRPREARSAQGTAGLASVDVGRPGSIPGSPTDSGKPRSQS